MRARLGIAVAVLLTITACGDGDDPASDPGPPTPSASASAEADDSASSAPAPELSSKQIESHLTDLFSQDPRLISRAMEMTAPGSTAETYTTFRLASANSNLDGGYPQDAWAVSMGTEEAEACPTDGECTTINDFELVDGQLAGYSLNGRALDKRLVMGNMKKLPVAGAGTVQFLVAYRTASDDALVVAVRLQAGSSGLSILDSFYRAKTGRQTASENISGPPDLGPDSSATYTMAFPGAQPGGTATARVYVNNGAPIPVSVDVR